MNRGDYMTDTVNQKMSDKILNSDKNIKITFLDSDTLGEDLKDKIQELFSPLGQLKINPSTPEDKVRYEVKTADVLVINKIKINQETMGDNPNVSLICIAATGYDNIDLEYCKSHGIAVANVEGYSAFSVAQLTVAMVLSLVCHLPEYNNFVIDGGYTKSGLANRLVPVYNELNGKVWGIVGGGNIGRRVAEVAKALGCRVIVCKRMPVDDLECVDIDTLCRKSDIISLHTPLNDSTKNLINRKRIFNMKKNVVLVNTARGGVADEEALTEAIEENRIGGLGIDVYTKEPFENDHPYSRILNNKNVCFTPHCAWGAYEARLRCISMVADNIKSYLCGGTSGRVDLR